MKISPSAIFVGITAAAAALLIALLWKPNKNGNEIPPGKKKIPSSTRATLPFVGELFDWIKFGPAAFVDSRFNEYGEIFDAKLFGGISTVFIRGPQGAEFINTYDSQKDGLQMKLPGMAYYILGERSLFNDHHNHRRLRKAFASSFSSSNIGAMIPKMNRITEWYVTKWVSSSSVETLDTFKQFKYYAFAVACTVLFEAEFDDKLNMIDEFERYLEGLKSVIPFELFGLTTFGRAMSARRNLLNAIEKVIESRKVGLEEKGQTAPNTNACVFDRLLLATDENGYELSMDVLKDNALAFLFAGHDTITASSSSAVYHFKNNPQVVDNILEEINRVVPNGNLSELQHDQLKQFVYVDAVIKEVLRINPPAAVILPRMSMRDLEFNGYHIPKGQVIISVSAHTHRDASVWPDPNAFVPERFLTSSSSLSSSSTSTPFAWTAFGVGSHVCLGMEVAKTEMKLLFIHLAAKIDWNKTVMTNVQPRVFPVPTIFSSVRFHAKSE